MTIQEFVARLARRNNNQIRFDGLPRGLCGPFCPTCYDERSELIPIAYNTQANTWDCESGHRLPNEPLPASTTARTGLR